MSDDPEGHVMRVLAGVAFAAALTWLALLMGPCAPAAKSNPLERISSRARIFRDGLHGTFVAGGTVDSVEYFPKSGYVARRDSSQLWVQVDGLIFNDSLTATGINHAAPVLDATGAGTYEFFGRIDGLAWYRENGVTQDGDSIKAGEFSGRIFRDTEAFVRITYQNFAPVDLLAWGAETLPYYDADGFRVDDGDRMIPVDSTRYQFDALTRAGGVRYVLKTVARWQVGADTYLRLEVSRDTSALAAFH